MTDDMLNPTATSKDEVSALARGLAVLAVVARAPGALSNRELADATKIPKATVSRLAATLVAAGYLRQQADSERFTLGAGVMELGSAYLRKFDLRSHARLHLAEVAEFAGASVHMGVREGLDIVVIDAIRPHSAVILSRLDVGLRLAISSSAMGRVYTAAVDAPARTDLLTELRQAAGKDWRKQAAKLQEAEREYAEYGYCSSFGDWHRDMHAIGVPVHGPGGELYAVSCGGPAYLLTERVMREKIAPRLMEAARAISKEAGQA
ncbi:IclR family transcriptional regulator [Ottowia thiooxydans]|uniref:IclR family transcriptional regulator n=1 Tax=Ottowia thiooxydans TaxID=219182 RepID=UPI00041C8950|nr:IclR family transcriptional regulator [Ottowia thiooxydans]